MVDYRSEVCRTCNRNRMHNNFRIFSYSHRIQDQFEELTSNNTYTFSHTTPPTLLSCINKVFYIYIQCFIAHQRTHTVDPGRLREVAAQGPNKIPIGSSVSQIAIRETSRKRPPKPAIKGGRYRRFRCI